MIVRAGCRSGSVCWDFAVASSRAICPVASPRAPIVLPISVASTHQPALTYIGVASSSWPTRSTVSAASSVADAPLSSTVALRKSPNLN